MSLTPRDEVARCSKEIWSVVELLQNQHANDGDMVAMSKGALQLCCNQIDQQLEELLKAVERLHSTSSGSE